MTADLQLTIGAVIPTFNRKESLRKCLTCLAEQDLDKEKYRLIPIVAVDGSSDGTLEMIHEEFPLTEIVEGNGNWWYTKSINEGVKHAQELGCHFVVTLNDDLFFYPDYLSKLLTDYFTQIPNSIVGSISLTLEKPHRISFSGVSHINGLLKERNYVPKFSIVDEQHLQGVKQSMVLSGRGLLYPVAILDELGYYDEKLVQYSSETDFTFRASKAGINVVISYNAIIYENAGLTSSGAVYNNPTLNALVKSFFSRYSINSLSKTFYYSMKHLGPLKGPIVAIIRAGGVVRNFLVVKSGAKQ